MHLPLFSLLPISIQVPYYLTGVHVAETDEMREPTQHYHANYATRRKESCTFYEEHKLRLTLIDLGMKLVCVPRNIYEHINKACQAMTPHDEDALDNQCITMDKLGKQQVLSCKWFCTFQRTSVSTNFRQPVRR
jgi:hypothetical protein